MGDLVQLDGSYGEGGGQILRTALALAALTGRPVRIEKIRAGRDKPGLRPQHLAAVRALARICSGHVEGDQVDSRALIFEPGAPPQAGRYEFDVAKIAGSGSAGAVTLLFQALFLPLACAGGESQVVLRGGTHVPFSPPYHYLTEVYLPFVRRIGLEAQLEIGPWGWFPRGGGEMTARIAGLEHGDESLRPIEVGERGKLLAIRGLAAASQLPEHVAERQRQQALRRLKARHLKGEIEMLSPPSNGPGTMLFLIAECEHIVAGFNGYGRLRYPAEQVADDAAEAFGAYLSSKAAFDPHLADQVLLPLALTPGASAYTTSEGTRHLTTVSWVIQQFIEREIVIEGAEGAPGRVQVR